MPYGAIHVFFRPPRAVCAFIREMQSACTCTAIVRHKPDATKYWSERIRQTALASLARAENNHVAGSLCCLFQWVTCVTPGWLASFGAEKGRVTHWEQARHSSVAGSYADGQVTSCWKLCCLNCSHDCRPPQNVSRAHALLVRCLSSWYAQHWNQELQDL